jgi:cytochrome c biogenesis protein CcdA/DsbC/DsbD-like thiol-disulfide interchange protein
VRSRLVPIAAMLALAAGVAAGCDSRAPASAERPRASNAARQIPVEIAPLVSASGVTPGSRIRVALDVKLPEGFHIQSNAPRDPTLIPTTLTLEPVDGVTGVEVVFPPSRDFVQEGSPQPLAVFEREFVIGVELLVASNAAPGEVRVPARLRYQACDDKVCFKPAIADVAWALRVVPAGAPIAQQHVEMFNAIAFGTGTPPAIASASTPAVTSPGGTDVLAQLSRFVIRGADGGYMDRDTFLEFLSNAEAGIARKGWFEDRGPLAILAIVFLGGLALNLTPCVLPMIPINLAIIGAGTRAGHRGRGMLLGATYGAAMAVVYGVLGLVVILSAGTFGTINASPWFNLGIAALFVVLALAMFDIVTIDFSRWSTRFRFDDASRGTFMLAFGMGAVAALLAGACVAPVVIQVVLFASDLYARGTAIALALPFLLGVGMAIPWPIAGAGLAALPKPGAWMVKVKYAFGVFILVTAAYYGYIAYGLFANRWVDPASVTAGVEAKLKEGWHASLADGLRVAEQTQTPVLLDLWATWCKNCLVMDETTLADPAVRAALEGYTRIKFQAEDPEAAPAKEVMEYVGAIGLPHYAVLHPPGFAGGR